MTGNSHRVKWFSGKINDRKSCNEICAENHGTCSVDKFRIDTKSQLGQICRQVGFNPTDNLPGEYPFRPIYCKKSGQCYGYGKRFDCTSKDTNPNPSRDQSCTKICPCLVGAACKDEWTRESCLTLKDLFGCTVEFVKSYCKKTCDVCETYTEICNFTNGTLDGSNFVKLDNVGGEQECAHMVKLKKPSALSVIYYPPGDCYANFGTKRAISTTGGRFCALTTELDCTCKDKVNHKGMGNCKGARSNHFGKVACYVNQPTSCSDARHSNHFPEEMYSAEACNVVHRCNRNSKCPQSRPICENGYCQKCTVLQMDDRHRLHQGTCPNSNQICEDDGTCSVRPDCTCKDKVNYKGMGNCKGTHSNHFGTVACYVNQPTDCSDAQRSNSFPEEMYSAEACNVATCSDGIQNQDETDVDCGGSTCNGCLPDDRKHGLGSGKP